MLGFLVEIVVALIIGYVIAYNTFLQRVISEHICVGTTDAKQQPGETPIARQRGSQHRRRRRGWRSEYGERKGGATTSSTAHKQSRKGAPIDASSSGALGLSFTASSTQHSNKSFTNTTEGRTGSDTWSWSDDYESTEGSMGSSLLNDDNSSSSSKWSSDDASHGKDRSARPHRNSSNANRERFPVSIEASEAENWNRRSNSERVSDAREDQGHVGGVRNAKRHRRITPDHDTHHRFRRQRKRHFVHRSHPSAYSRAHRAASEKASQPGGTEKYVDVLQETTRWVESLARWGALLAVGGGSPDPNVWTDHVAYLAVSSLSSTDHQLERLQRKRATECVAAVRDEAARSVSESGDGSRTDGRCADYLSSFESFTGNGKNDKMRSQSLQQPEYPVLFGTPMPGQQLPHLHGPRKHSKRAVELLRVALGSVTMPVTHALSIRAGLRGLHPHHSARDFSRSNGRPLLTPDTRFPSNNNHRLPTTTVSVATPALTAAPQFRADGARSSQRASPSPVMVEPLLRAYDDSSAAPATPQLAQPNANASGDPGGSERVPSKTRGDGALWRWIPKSVNFSFMSSSRVRTSFERQQEYVMTQLAKLQADLFGKGAAGGGHKRSDSISASAGVSTPVNMSMSMRTVPHMMPQGVGALSSLSLPPVGEDTSVGAMGPLDNRRLPVLPHHTGADSGAGGGDTVMRGSSSSPTQQRGSAKATPAPQHSRGPQWPGHLSPSMCVGFVLPLLRSVQSATLSGDKMDEWKRSRSEPHTSVEAQDPPHSNTQDELEAECRSSEHQHRVQRSPLRAARYFEASLEYEDMNFSIRLGCNIPLFAFFSFPFRGKESTPSTGEAPPSSGMRLALPPDLLTLRCVVDASRIRFVGKVYVCVSGNVLEFGFPSTPAYAVSIVAATTGTELDEWKRMSSPASVGGGARGAIPIPQTAPEATPIATYPSMFTNNTYATYSCELAHSSSKASDAPTAARRAGSANAPELPPSRTGCISPSNEKIQEMIHLGIKNGLDAITFPRVIHARVAKRGRQQDQRGKQASHGPNTETKITAVGPLEIRWRLQMASLPPPP